MSNPAQTKRRGQRGMALVMVMGVLAVTLLMVVHVMTVCELAGRDAYVNASRSELRYVAESALAHSFWMHLTDRRLFTNRKLGTTSEARLGDASFEPWMADRRAHEILDGRAVAYIGTVEKSIKLTDPSSFKQNVSVDDTETLELITDFLDVLADYTDSDFACKLAGMEEDDYAASGIPSLPRNAAMQFREELYWLPGWKDAVKGEVTIIPPKGKSFSNRNSKPSFFSASEAEIQRILDLSDTDLESVLEARRLWVEEGRELSETLDAGLLLNANNNFNFTESNVAQYSVSVPSSDGSFRVLRSVVRECDLSKASIYSDRNSQTFSIWSATSW